MARKVIVLALLLVAFVGMSSADTISDDVIGTDDGTQASAPSIDGPVAGPLSSVAAAGGDGTGAGAAAAGPAGAKPPSQSDATTIKVSVIAGVAMVAGYFF